MSAVRDVAPSLRHRFAMAMYAHTQDVLLVKEALDDEHARLRAGERGEAQARAGMNPPEPGLLIIMQILGHGE